MTTITTRIERQEDRIVIQRPGERGTSNLVEAEENTGDYFVASLNSVETAIRKAYAMGRQDERRQTSAVLRSLLSE